LIRARCADDIDEPTFDSIRRGLQMARADENGEDGNDDEPIDGEIARLILQTIDALAAKQARLEQACATLGVDPGSFAHQAEPGIDPPAGGIIEPVSRVEPMMGR
jgi:hypothetical protein